MSRLSVLLWVGLWAGVNTGPWVLREDPAGLGSWVHYLRTLLPPLVFGLGLLLGLGRRVVGGEEEQRGGLPLSLRLWAFYGFLGLVACSRSPHPWDALYWASAYLAVLAVVAFVMRGEGAHPAAVRARDLNGLTWALTAAMLVVLVLVSRQSLFVETKTGISGYGVVGRVGSVGGVAVSRASGMARFAAIPCLVAFGLFLRARRAWRLLWGPVGLASAYLVYLMQSRGAIVALALALAFTAFVMGRRSRWIAVLMLLLMGVLLVGNVLSEGQVERVGRHLTRNTSVSEMRTLTGRTLAWMDAWKLIEGNPFLGWGPQADRYLIEVHVHNTYLYAWLTAGVIGFLAFLAGLAAGWRDLVIAVRRRPELGERDRVLVVIASAIVIFFTVRSIPEVSGAMFGIDLLVFAPALAYLGAVATRGRGPSDSEAAGAEH